MARRVALTICLSALGSALAAWQPAAAQPAPLNKQSSASAAVPQQLQEVVVTAEKRAASEQTTPIAMTVYSGAQLRQNGIVNISTLATQDTSLNFSWANGGTAPFLAIRGISSTDVTEIGDPSVAVGTDGFFTNRPYGLLASLYDIKRIEVLRGPQGTLYGRNATGGVVNIITAKPTRHMEFRGSVQYGNYNTLDTTAMANIPISKSVQIRFAYASNKRDGYRKIFTELGVPAEQGGDQDTHSGRIEIAFEPTRNFHGLITVQDTQIGGTGNVEKLIPFVANPAIPGDILHVIPPIGNTKTWTNYSPTYQRLDDKQYRLKLEYDNLFAGNSLLFLGGYDNTQWHHSLPINGLFGTPNTTPYSFVQNEYPKTQNYELRLISPSHGLVTWVAGLYYFEERSTNLNSYTVENPGASNALTTFGFEFPLVEARSRAVYGQASVRLTKALRLSLGARYTKDNKERTGVENVPLFNLYGISQFGTSNSSKATWHVGLDWKPTQNSFEYIKADKGYKAGGFTTCNSYAPETVTSYEVGTKNQLDNNRLRVNFDGFFMNYKNKQVQMDVPSSVCISNSTVQNAGGAHIYGAEGSVDALLGSIGRANLNFTLLHARYSSFVAAPGIAAAVADCKPYGTTGNCQLAGNVLNNAPTLTISAGFEHGWSLPDGMTLDGRVQARYISKVRFDSFNYASTTQGGYTLTDVYLNLLRGHWTISGYVRNLSNHTYFSYMQENYTNGDYVYAFGAPRTYGVRVSVFMY